MGQLRDFVLTIGGLLYGMAALAIVGGALAFLVWVVLIFAGSGG